MVSSGDAMEISLSRRAAIVTGGSKGLGFAMAARFAASGADIAIVARTGDALKEAVSTMGKSSSTTWRAVRPACAIARRHRPKT